MTKLISKPLRHCSAPAYPTKLEVLADPELLRRHVPPAWLNREEIAGVLGVLLAANAGGCGRSEASFARSKGLAAGAPAVVAPVFEHGLGEAGHWDSCDGSPPSAVYLSEEMGLQIICDELARYGLMLTEHEVTFESIRVPHEQYERAYNWVTDEPGSQTYVVRLPLEVDLFDSEKAVAVEFIAREDFMILGGSEVDARHGYQDLRDISVSLTREVRRQGRGFYFGVFYDPVTYSCDREVGYRHRLPPWPNEDCQKRIWVVPAEDAENRSKRLLRQQVKGFVDWLKGQGVI